MDKILSQDIILYVEKELSSKDFNCASFFSVLKNKYRAIDIALICNYILEKSEDSKLLSFVIREVKMNKYRHNFNSLLSFIKNTQDDDLKALAIKAICVYKDSNVAPVLLECLQDKNSNYRVRFSAADALGKIGGKNAFEALKYVVCDEEEKSAYVKESAVVALGNLGDNRAIDVFSSILSSKQIFLDKFACLKERVVEAISKLDNTKDDKALEILKISIFDPSAQVRINSIEALMNINNRESYQLIYERLVLDSDFEVKKNALIALYNMSDRRILDEVLNGDFQNSIKAVAQEIIDEYEDDNE
ncbi:MAG: HEAT repeat domain-containing protein [Candidatus Gastranaerophilales bacterium]|nr:HEAT repeat domain-containing protein [Candidatus Gastranaerophilales bacterium]